MATMGALVPTLASTLLLVAACASSPPPEPRIERVEVAAVDGGSVVPPASPVAAADPEVTPAGYTTDARVGFARAEAAFARADYDKAERDYRYVATHFPYALSAKEAELRLADIALARGQRSEAARAYEEWTVKHRSDPRLPEVHQRALDAKRDAH